MIAFLHGKLEFAGDGDVVVDVGGVGYRVSVPGSTLSRLPAVGEPVKLFTRHLIRDDEMYLYGFISRDELALFTHLVSVSGVGPKGAMAVLSSFAPETLRSAVAEENVHLLAKAHGIGKKTAGRIILELKDKLGSISTYENLPQSGVNGINEEAVAALVSLGYRQPEAKKIVARTIEENGKQISVEEIIKNSLKALDNL